MKKFFRDNWAYVLAGTGILILYFVRLYHLSILPVFVDEAIYIRWSQIMAAEPTLRFLPLSDGKEPLFMWFLMFVVNRFSDPLFIGRAVSVASGFGTMIGIALLTYLLFKNRLAAVVASFLYVMSPFTFFFDRMALVDSMLTMFGVWTFILAYLAFTKKRLDFAMLAGFALGGAWLTKSTAILFTLMLPTLWIFSEWKRRKNFSIFLKLLFLSSVTVVIAMVMYNILRLGPNFNLIGSRNQDYVYPINHIFTSPFDPLKGHLNGIINYFYLMGPIGLVALWLLGYFVDFKKYWKGLAVLTIWAVVPILITAEYFKVVTARYVLFTIPFFIVIASFAFLSKKKILRVLATLSAIAFIVQSVNFNWNLLTNVAAAPFPSGERTGYLTEWTAGWGIKEISVYLKSQARSLKPDEKLVVGTEGYFGTLPDGLQMYMQGVKNVTVIGVGLGFFEIPDPLAASFAAGNKTYLVINKSRLLVNSTNPHLKLIASYLKPGRSPASLEYKRFGPQDSLLFFEVQ